MTNDSQIITAAAGDRGIAARIALGVAVLLAFGHGGTAAEDDRAPTKQPKKIFAHYMGCAPIGTGPQHYERQLIGQTLKHTKPREDHAHFGGHVRNYDLIEPKTILTLEESADLEIRRALRIGIDGFAVDAWAGGDVARGVLDALFKVAEEKDYPFELTI